MKDKGSSEHVAQRRFVAGDDSQSDESGVLPNLLGLSDGHFSVTSTASGAEKKSVFGLMYEISLPATWSERGVTVQLQHVQSWSGPQK